MYEQPTWKKVEKNKWKTTNGMSFSGQPSAHVSNAKTKLFGAGASKKVEFATNTNNVWEVVKNETECGANPYPGGY